MEDKRKTYRYRLINGSIAWTLVLSACLLCVVSHVRAQHQVIPFHTQGKGNLSVLIDDVALSRQANSTLSLQMQFSLVGVRMPSNSIAEIVPRLYTATEWVDFPAVRLYGRGAYYHEVRSLDAPEEEVMEFRDRDAYEVRAYAKQVAYSNWMAGAKLKFVVRALDGCGNELSHAEQRYYLPQQQAQTPVAPATDAAHYEVTNSQKTEHLQGRAYISFRVNRTEIDPVYQNNTRELERIRHSIDSLLQQKDVVMKHLTLKGFASPEGSYALNTRLASGRVHSLKQYFIDTYGLDHDIISVDYEPEDWEGLRQYVDGSQLSHRKEILSLIDSDQDPDVKLRQIQARYPRDYRFLLDSVFVNLRHTDYRIDYVRMWEEQERSNFQPPSTGAPAMTTGVPDSVLVLPEKPSPELTQNRVHRYKPLLAVKTNLLFDAALCPNIELEVPLGRRGAWSRWSLMAEWWFPWWRLDHNPKGDVNPYYRSDQRPTKKSYELLTGGMELRYWMLPRCNGSRPWLTGTFVGLYAAGGKYDFEWKSEGSQGEFVSAGISIGHSWAISRHWNLELSAAAGYIYTPYRYYEAEFDDTHLIYRYSSKKHLIAPTKLKVSLVWILGKKIRPKSASK